MRGSDVEIEIDRSRCVFCGEPNECALARDGSKADRPCWCVAESFPKALLTRADEADGGECCICRRCLEKDRRETNA